MFRLVDGLTIHDPNAIKKFTESKRPRPLRTNANFAKDEFKELWKRINHKTAYTVEFSSEELIRKAIEALDRQIDIPKLTYMVKKAIRDDQQLLQKHIYDYLTTDSAGEKNCCCG